MPLFASNPIAKAVSSIVYPSAPAMGAAYLKVSPIIDTFVLEFDEAAANTSEKCPASFADSPKAVKASVTISDTVPNSSPEAAARFIMPSIPFSISSAFQPAIAIYSIALPASVAENTVFAPISLAFSESFFMSSEFAFEIAPTVLICFSKSEPTLVEAPTTPATAVAPTFTAFATALKVLSATFSIFPKPLSRSLNAVPNCDRMLLFVLAAALAMSCNSFFVRRVELLSEASTLPAIFIAISYSLFAKFYHLLCYFLQFCYRQTKEKV